MKASELRSKSVAELRQERRDLLKEQFNLRMQKSTDQLSKPHQFRRIRRNIARINGVLHEMRKKADKE